MTPTEQTLYEQNVKQGHIIMQYRKLFMNLLDAKQKRYELDPRKAPMPDRIELMQIEKEEYDRWRKVQKIIEDATYKDDPMFPPQASLTTAR